MHAFYVSLDGSDSNDGSELAPLASIATGFSKLTDPGDSLTILAGEYPLPAEGVQLDASGTTEEPIVVRGAPGATVTLLYTARGTIPPITITGSHIILSNLQLLWARTAWDQPALHIRSTSNGNGLITTAPSDVQVTDCTISCGHWNTGILIDAPGGKELGIPRGAGITIQRTTVTSCGKAVHVAAGDDVTVVRSNISINDSPGIVVAADVDPRADAITGGTRISILGNILFRNYTGIMLTTGVKPEQTTQQVFSDITIANNFIYNYSDGILVHDERTDNVTTIRPRILHNTLYWNGTHQLVLGHSLDAVVANNIFGKGHGEEFVQLMDVPAAAVNPLIDYNFYDGWDGCSVLWRLARCIMVDFAEWQAAGHDTHGLLGSAGFMVAEFPFDLHLAPGASPINSASTDPAFMVTDDIDGDARPMHGAPDIGADECASDACLATSLGSGASRGDSSSSSSAGMCNRSSSASGGDSTSQTASDRSDGC